MGSDLTSWESVKSIIFLFQKTLILAFEATLHFISTSVIIPAGQNEFTNKTRAAGLNEENTVYIFYAHEVQIIHYFFSRRIWWCNWLLHIINVFFKRNVFKKTLGRFFNTHKKCIYYLLWYFQWPARLHFTVCQNLGKKPFNFWGTSHCCLSQR